MVSCYSTPTGSRQPIRKLSTIFSFFKNIKLVLLGCWSAYKEKEESCYHHQYTHCISMIFLTADCCNGAYYYLMIIYWGVMGWCCDVDAWKATKTMPRFHREETRGKPNGVCAREQDSNRIQIKFGAFFESRVVVFILSVHSIFSSLSLILRLRLFVQYSTIVLGHIRKSRISLNTKRVT